jgi:hypothetical protein
MIQKPSTRVAGSGVIADLGAVMLGLALLDVTANARSTLRAVRARLAKGGKLSYDHTARVRDAAVALRELLAHAVTSATTAGGAGREIVKDTALPNEVLEQLVIALARSVYDGLVPDDEHPLVLPGVDANDAFTAAPVLAASDESGEGAVEPVLGLYTRVAFVALPYAGVGAERASVPRREGAMSEPPPPPRSARPIAPLDEAAFSRAHDALERAASGDASAGIRTLNAVRTTLDARVDPAHPRFAWRRASEGAFPALFARAVQSEGATPRTHAAVLVGPRGAGHSRALLDGLAEALLTTDRTWHVLVPRAHDRTLGFEPVGPGRASAALRRADLSRWLDEDVPRSVRWDSAVGEPFTLNVVINASALDRVDKATLRSLVSLARDVADKTEPRTLVLLAGASHIGVAARLLEAFARYPELESTAAPLRAGSVWLVRTDAPLDAPKSTGSSAPLSTRRGTDETLLATMSEPFTPGSALLGDLAARSALVPADAKYRARLLRWAALGPVAGERRALERAASEPASGGALRRALQSGVASLSSARAALCAGLGVETIAAMEHEVRTIVSEYRTAREPSTHAARLGDVARGHFVELLFAAYPKAALLAHAALLDALGPSAPSDLAVRAEAFDTLHSGSLGMRAAGTLYARASSTTVPLGFVLPGTAVDSFALVEITALPEPGSIPPRSLAHPFVEIEWSATDDRESSLGLAATVVATFHDVARRLVQESPLRTMSREGRPTVAALIDVSIDARLVPDAIRIALPLRANATEADAHRLAVETVARILDATGTHASEWSAHTLLTDATATAPSPVLLAGPLLLRDFAARWSRALRILPRHFPIGGIPNPRYSPEPLIDTAVELGFVNAVLTERGISPTSPGGRAVLARLGGASGEVAPRAREIFSQLPVRTNIAEANEWEVVERCVALAWFFHANFCAEMPGPLQFSPRGGGSVQPLIEQFIDRASLKLWLQRKTSRPAAVESRVASLIAMLEPTIVVEKL